MNEHGVLTSRADLWAHVCLPASKIFYYWREEMAAAIRAGRFVERIGRSRDGAPTTIGRLVPVSDPLVAYVHLLAHLAQPILDALPAPVHRLCDRERGALAERLFAAHARGWLPALFVAEPQRARAQQIAGIDFVLRPPTVEVKCDNGAAETGNLYVQTHERGHRPLLAEDGVGGLIERDVPLPGFEEGAA